MTQILANAQIIDPENDRVFLGGVVIEDDKIAEVFEGDYAGDGEAIDLGGKHLAPGIIDIGVKIGEPGERHKESFRSASDAALVGGITTVVARADTNPPIDTPETLAFARARAEANTKINILHSAALTKDRAGLEMTEIGFLKDAGAVAFGDGDAVIQDTKTAFRAYNYAKMMDRMVIGHIQEPKLSAGAVATSGTLATLLGLSAVSVMAEKIGLQREMALVEMSGVKFHIDQVTTAVALPVLERARAAGLPITAAASIHHIALNENDIGDYRTFFKLKPPLRTEDDRQAIITAMRDGLIDCISSMHTPQDEESKRLPFEDAAAGAVGLETLLPASLRLYHDGSLTLPQLFKLLSSNPASLLGLNKGRIVVGADADLIALDIDHSWVLDRHKLRSKVKNTPFDGAHMQGRVLAVWVGGFQHYNTDGATK